MLQSENVAIVQEFENIDAVTKAFEKTQNLLKDYRNNYIKRRDAIRSQVWMCTW